MPDSAPRKRGANPSPVISPRVTTAIAVTITVVWACSFVADIFIRDYDPSPFVHALMMAVAGTAFGHRFLRNGSADR